MLKDKRLIDRQIVANGCVPIAISNALVWSGALPGKAIDHFHKLEEIMSGIGYSGKSGCHNDTIHHTLSALGFEFECIVVRSVAEVETALEYCDGVLLAYVWSMADLRPARKSRAHLILVDGHEGRFLNAYNVNGNGAEYKPRLDEYLRKCGGRVWLLKKRDPDEKALDKSQEAAKMVAEIRSSFKEFLDERREQAQVQRREEGVHAQPRVPLVGDVPLQRDGAGHRPAAPVRPG